MSNDHFARNSSYVSLFAPSHLRRKVTTYDIRADVRSILGLKYNVKPPLRANYAAQFVKRLPRNNRQTARRHMTKIGKAALYFIHAMEYF
jgi:hypothetical protein